MLETGSVDTATHERGRVRRAISGIGTCVWLLWLVACGEPASLRVSDGQGPAPVLPPPTSSLIPTVDIAPAVGWEAEGHPQAAPGFAVQAFARGLDHPRWLYVLPNGDVLVAESNAPANPHKDRGLRDIIAGWIMARAGAGGPSADRITLLRDTDGDGVADFSSVFIEDLKSPFGMALVDDEFYVANTDAVVRFPYETGTTTITAPGERIAALPAGPINHHWTKNVVADARGEHLYVTVGSNSNVAENGMDEEENRAAILEIKRATGTMRPYATGLRNPNGLAWHPADGRLWTTVNERDEIGGDLVPDYLASVVEDGFYGWPYSYFGQHVDTRVTPQRPDLVARARVPEYALGPHTASLGLVFYTGEEFAPRYRGGAFVAQHGSWNRKPKSGYRVIFIPFDAGRPAGPPIDILAGFIDDKGNAQGRPAGLAIDAAGALLVADDVGDTVWRVTPGARTMDVH